MIGSRHCFCVSIALRSALISPGGFCVRKRIDGGPVTVIPSCIGFPGRTEPPGALRPTTAWPIQNFHWSDIDVPLGAAVSYQLVPMVVAPASQQTTAVSAVMEPLEALATAWTEPVVLEVSGETQCRVSPRFSVYFSRGLLASEWLCRHMPVPLPLPTDEKDGLDAGALALAKELALPESPARVQLGGSLRQGLLALLRSVATPTDTAASATTCLEAYACVADVDADEPELMPALTALGRHLHLILGPCSSPEARARTSRRLRTAGAEVHERVLVESAGRARCNHKFVVVVDRPALPAASQLPPLPPPPPNTVIVPTPIPPVTSSAPSSSSPSPSACAVEDTPASGPADSPAVTIASGPATLSSAAASSALLVPAAATTTAIATATAASTTDAAPPPPDDASHAPTAAPATSDTRTEPPAEWAAALPPGHEADKPLRVWTGSGDWTAAALCAQANVGLLVESACVASWFYAAWHRICAAGDTTPPTLRTENSVARTVTFRAQQASAEPRAAEDVLTAEHPSAFASPPLSSGPSSPDSATPSSSPAVSVSVWMCPTTGHVDIAHARRLIRRARDAVLFLVHTQGPKGTLVNDIVDLPQTRPRHLYIHGLVHQVPPHPAVLFHHAEQVVVPPALFDAPADARAGDTGTDTDAGAGGGAGQPLAHPDYWVRQLLRLMAWPPLRPPPPPPPAPSALASSPAAFPQPPPSPAPPAAARDPSLAVPSALSASSVPASPPRRALSSTAPATGSDPGVVSTRTGASDTGSAGTCPSNGAQQQQQPSRGGSGAGVPVGVEAIVVDPFGAHPVVMTGSHAFGSRASNANDDNLVIVENDHALAEAFAVYIAAVVDQFRVRLRGRRLADQGHPAPWASLDPTDAWQRPYLLAPPAPAPAAPADPDAAAAAEEAAAARRREVQFWVECAQEQDAAYHSEADWLSSDGADDDDVDADDADVDSNAGAGDAARAERGADGGSEGTTAPEGEVVGDASTGAAGAEAMMGGRVAEEGIPPGDRGAGERNEGVASLSGPGDAVASGSAERYAVTTRGARKARRRPRLSAGARRRPDVGSASESITASNVGSSAGEDDDSTATRDDGDFDGEDDDDDSAHPGARRKRRRRVAQTGGGRARARGSIGWRGFGRGGRGRGRHRGTGAGGAASLRGHRRGALSTGPAAAPATEEVGTLLGGAPGDSPDASFDEAADEGALLLESNGSAPPPPQLATSRGVSAQPGQPASLPQGAPFTDNIDLDTGRPRPRAAALRARTATARLAASTASAYYLQGGHGLDGAGAGGHVPRHGAVGSGSHYTRSRGAADAAAYGGSLVGTMAIPPTAMLSPGGGDDGDMPLELQPRKRSRRPRGAGADEAITGGNAVTPVRGAGAPMTAGHDPMPDLRPNTAIAAGSFPAPTLPAPASSSESTAPERPAAPPVASAFPVDPAVIAAIPDGLGADEVAGPAAAASTAIATPRTRVRHRRRGAAAGWAAERRRGNRRRRRRTDEEEDEEDAFDSAESPGSDSNANGAGTHTRRLPRRSSHYGRRGAQSQLLLRSATAVSTSGARLGDLAALPETRRSSRRLAAAVAAVAAVADERAAAVAVDEEDGIAPDDAAAADATGGPETATPTRRRRGRRRHVALLPDAAQADVSVGTAGGTSVEGAEGEVDLAREWAEEDARGEFGAEEERPDDRDYREGTTGSAGVATVASSDAAPAPEGGGGAAGEVVGAKVRGRPRKRGAGGRGGRGRGRGRVRRGAEWPEVDDGSSGETDDDDGEFVVAGRAGCLERRRRRRRILRRRTTASGTRASRRRGAAAGTEPAALASISIPSVEGAPVAAAPVAGGDSEWNESGSEDAVGILRAPDSLAGVAVGAEAEVGADELSSSYSSTSVSSDSESSASGDAHSDAGADVASAPPRCSGAYEAVNLAPGHTDTLRLPPPPLAVGMPVSATSPASAKVPAGEAAAGDEFSSEGEDDNTGGHTGALVSASSVDEAGRGNPATTGPAVPTASTSPPATTIADVPNDPAAIVPEGQPPSPRAQPPPPPPSQMPGDLASEGGFSSSGEDEDPVQARAGGGTAGDAVEVAAGTSGVALGFDRMR